MIIRVYRATALPGRESEVAGQIRRSIEDVRTADGCLHVEGGHRLLVRSLEFVVVSLWRDLSAIEAFGKRFGSRAIDETLFPDRMAGVLSESRVEHFEGLESA